MATLIFVPRACGGTILLSIAPATPPTNALFLVRAGQANALVRSGTASAQVRSGTAQLEVRN